MTTAVSRPDRARNTFGVSITGPSRRITVEPVEVPREPTPLPQREPAEEPERREPIPSDPLPEPERVGAAGP